MAYMAGFWDSIGNWLSSLGITAATSTAVARAMASPSLANIDAVKAAFAAEGTTCPPELLDAIYERYYAAVKDYPAIYGSAAASTVISWLPWVALGVIGFLAIKRR